MSKRDRKSEKVQDIIVKGAPIQFDLVPVRNGHDVELQAEIPCELEDVQIQVPVRRGTPQFRPMNGKQYLCDVRLRRNASGKWSGRATPCRETVSLLTGDEWNTDLRDALTVRLTFRKGGNGRPIAFYDGSPVFPAKGSEVVMRQSRTYLLQVRDGFCYGAVLVDQASRDHGHRGSNAKTVEVRVPVAKGIAAQSEDDLDYRHERKSIAELLGIPGDGASAVSVKAAAEAKIKALRLDKPKPFILQRMTEEFAKAIKEARDKALAILVEENTEAAPEEPETATGEEEEPEEELDTLVAE